MGDPGAIRSSLAQAITNWRTIDGAGSFIASAHTAAGPAIEANPEGFPGASSATVAATGPAA